MSHPVLNYQQLGKEGAAGLGRHALKPETGHNQVVASGMREKLGVALLERTNARVRDMKVCTKDK